MLLAGVVAGFAFALSANAACTKTYTVATGDTCLTIPQKNSISSYQLTKLNPSLNCNLLSVGASLCVIDSTYNCQPVYTVKSGDGCWDIANSHGIDSNQLTVNNPQIGTNCAIQPGQNLCVAGAATSSAPAITTSTRTTSAASPTASCTKTYTVKSNDNCNVIAASNTISNYQLGYLNPSMDCSKLSIGQTLCVTSAAYTCQPVYTVKSGDTCYAIATSYSITTDVLIANNPNVGSSCALSVGMSLCVKGASTTTSRASSSIATGTTSAAAPTGTACTRVTTVQSNETCDSIGLRTGISRYWIGQLNPTINAACSNIVAGQSLCVDSPKHNCGSVYQITGKEGGCQGVIDSLKMTLSTLVSLNPNVNTQCSNIYVNEVLCTAPRPTGAPSTACTQHYTIQASDTCLTIAAKNSLTNTQLTSLNPGLNCNALSVGSTLCSFSPSLSICPKLVQVVLNDTCFALAKAVAMSLAEWQSLNAGVNCDALQLSSLVCSAQGNATLPQAPSGSNPTSGPLCAAYDKKQRCCTMYSVSADLYDSPLCQRANGCQENCIGDSGVTKPTTSARPTFTISPVYPPTPTANPSACSNCTTTQCCSVLGTCEAPTSWYCRAANGCTKNCDTWNTTSVDFPGSWYDSPTYEFPIGDFSKWGGNPCQSCNSSNAFSTSASGKYCCAYGTICAPQEWGSCLVQNGCLYNCIDHQMNSTSYELCDNNGVCDYQTVTVLQPWATATAAAITT